MKGNESQTSKRGSESQSSNWLSYRDGNFKHCKEEKTTKMSVSKSDFPDYFSFCCCLNETLVHQHVVSAVSSETEQGLLYILCPLFSFAFNTRLKTLTHTRTDKTDDLILIIGPAASFCSYSKIVSANVSQRCPGRSAAHATGRGPSTGPTHLISRLRWWDWHSRVTK